MMSSKPFDKLNVKKILVVSLTNVGDVILTFPVLDILLEDFSDSELSVVVGPKARELLDQNPLIKNVYVFDKKGSPLEKWRWVNLLRQERFDLVIDLRHTAIPFFIGAKYRTSFRRMNGKKGQHIRSQHLRRLQEVYDYRESANHRSALYISSLDKAVIDQQLKNFEIEDQPFIVMSPGAAHHLKCWTPSGFAQVGNWLMERDHYKIVLVGDRNEISMNIGITEQMRQRALNLTGKTTLPQLAELLHRSAGVIANDSAVMHLASYLDVPTLAIFGPTNEAKYGPWGARCRVIRRELFCAPCEKSACRYQHECMQLLDPKDVYAAFEKNVLKS